MLSTWSTASSTVALWVRSAATARCRADSIVPERPPRSRMRYDSEKVGEICVRADVLAAIEPVPPLVPPKVLNAPPPERVALTSSATVGKREPRADPYDAAADCASAHDSRVAGL